MSQAASSEESRRMITALEMSGNFRVLRRFVPAAKLLAFESMQAQAESKLAMVLQSRAIGGAGGKVVELGYQVVRFHPKTGVIYEVEAEYSAFEDPGQPVGARFQTSTGISDGDLAGTQFDDARINADIERSVVFICHDAGSQRVALERRFPALKDQWFICSEREMDWRSYGASCKALEYLAFAVGGFFFSGNRAVLEAQVLVDLLARKGPDGLQLLRVLMDRSRRPAWRVWATNSPLEARETLEARGYKWSDGSDPVRPFTGWWKATESLDVELDFLAKCVYGGPATIQVEKVVGRERYSGRLGLVEEVEVGGGAGAQDNLPPREPEQQAGQKGEGGRSGGARQSNGLNGRDGSGSHPRQRGEEASRQMVPHQSAEWSGVEFPI